MAQRAYRNFEQPGTPSPLRPAETPLQRDSGRQAYQILHVAFTLAPLIAGADKYFHVLVNWDQYMAPLGPRITGLSAHNLMLIAGGIEIVAAIGILTLPKVFSYIVAAWLAGIIANLLILGNYYDIALRDLGLCLGALALGRLSARYA